MDELNTVLSFYVEENLSSVDLPEISFYADINCELT